MSFNNRISPEDESGFTLIELIVSLVMVGVITVVAGMAMVPFMEGYITTRTNAEITRKVQIAMTRMIKEFTVVSSVSSGTGTSITFSAEHAGGTRTCTLSWAGSAGDPLMLDGDILTDGVESFQLLYVYTDGSGSEVVENTWTADSQGIEIRLTMQGADNILYTARAYPRNL